MEGDISTFVIGLKSLATCSEKARFGAAYRHRYACFLGRPPLAPLARAAAAFAGVVDRPACRAIALLIQSLVPNTPATSAG